MMVDENVSGDVLYEATNDELQKNIQKINVMSKVSQSIETFPIKKKDFWYDSDKLRDKKQSNKKNALPDKFYCERDSVLTDLFKVVHIRTIFNVCMLCFFFLFMHAIVTDIILESDRLYIGIMTIEMEFGKFSSCAYIWSLMLLSTIGVYAAFSLWAYRRFEFLPKSLIRKAWDYGWLTVFIVYNFLFIFLLSKAIINENLPPFFRFYMLIEQWRMTMKSYAFVRSMAPRFLSYKAHNETAPPNNCPFSHYMYFLFAPTLLYCDSYPRTKRIRWMVVIKHFAQVCIVFVCINFVWDRYMRPVINVFGTRDLELKWYIKCLLELSILSIFLVFTLNYLVLHAWMNAWAEMLRFADRLFYKDYWNSLNFGDMLPKWNVVVHDWLYKYIYKEMYEKIVPGKRSLSIITVFFISGIVHDYILFHVFCFYYPTYFFLFIIMCCFTLLKRYFNSNIILWIKLCLCQSILFSMYLIEYYARFNCTPYSNYYADLFLPRSWNCQRVETFVSN